MITCVHSLKFKVSKFKLLTSADVLNETWIILTVKSSPIGYKLLTSKSASTLERRLRKKGINCHELNNFFQKVSHCLNGMSEGLHL